MGVRWTKARTRLALTIAAGGVLAALAVGAIAAQSAGTPIATELTAPRGLTAVDDGLLVAEGGGGRLLKIADDGSVEVLAEGLPATLEGGPMGSDPAGIASAVAALGRYFFVTGEFEADGFQSLYALEPGGDPELIADLGEFEAANNPDGEVDDEGNPEHLSNPYDLVVDPGGGLFISDAGANAILRVDLTGTVSVYAAFPNRENPLFGTVGGPTMDTVPTGLALAPDGALYVATLTGFPFPRGAAVIYRLTDANGDGDALDDGEAIPVIEGLTTATDLAFLPDGSILVTEFSTNILEMAPGRLVRVTQQGAVTQIEEVAGPLVSPTSVEVTPDGRVFVSQEFAGVVSQHTLPPPRTLPLTGTGGLAGERGTGVWWIVGASVAAAMCAGAAAWSLRRLR